MTESAPITVHDVMTPQPAMIDGLATVREAVEIMREKKFSSLIIKKRDVDDEYGMVSMPEIARQVIEPDLSIDRTNVYQVMVKPVLSVDGHMNIRYAIRLLSRYGETRALVLEQGIAVGIVTLRDMVFRYIEDRL